jgi:hypothetical protein
MEMSSHVFIYVSSRRRMRSLRMFEANLAALKPEIDAPVANATAFFLAARRYGK